MTLPTISQQITWVYTTDTQASFHFWGDVLGFALERDAGSARIYHTAQGARVGVCAVFADRVVEPAGSMITLITDDVDGWYDTLTGQGVQTKGPPEVLAAFNIYSFFCFDPMGYTVEFQQFLD